MSATPTDLLDRCRRRGITLYLDGAALRYRGPRGALTPELRQVVAEHRADLIALLGKSSKSPGQQPVAAPVTRSQRTYLPCCCPAGICWPCCNRPCEVCRMPTGSAFIRRCVLCGELSDVG
jgi:hypothetical protein